MTARLLRRLALGVALASLTSVVGCAAETEDPEAAAADEALTGRVLKAGECAVTAPNRSHVAGVYDAALNGCFIARGNETGDAMIGRAIAILTNPSEIGGATHPGGTKMFASFKANAPQGTLAGGGTFVYDARVGLDIVGPFDAKGTLRFSTQGTATGGVLLVVTNTTSIGALGVNPVQANGLEFIVRFTPAQNGVVITGSVKVTLVSQKDSVGQVSMVAPEIVSWLSGKLGAR